MPFVDDAEVLLHRDVAPRAVEHLGRDDEAIAGLDETRVLAQFIARTLEHGDALARQTDQQGRRVALPHDGRALAGAAARRFAALDEQNATRRRVRR